MTRAKKSDSTDVGNGEGLVAAPPVDRVAGALEKADKSKKKDKLVTIKPPRIELCKFKVIGTEPLVTNAWSEKARQKMKAVQEAGSQSRSRKVREPKDFRQSFEDAIYRSHPEGWPGFPAHLLRNALINACRLVGFKMTVAKLALFVQGDGYDKQGTALLRIRDPKDPMAVPEYDERAVRNETGVADIRARPRWMPGWFMEPVIEVDLDQFALRDVVNLLEGAGKQVGIGEGRPNSPNSTGIGWGRFKVESEGMDFDALLETAAEAAAAMKPQAP